tara:strand:- start:619 stop:1308 length:690 start_codon:yes stop_codon:yes gene_type:complete
MAGLALDKLRFSRATSLRLLSAIVSAAIFGMLAAPLTHAPYWLSAFALAFIFGFFFVGGTGYRILIAVAFQDASRKASASWSGATAASALAALCAAILLIGRDEASILVLAAYAVAINTAYIPVKFACLEAGCCHAHRRDPVLIRNHDLRHVEIALTTAVAAASLASIWMDAFGVAAVLGTGGHLVVRVLSRWSRDRLPGSSLDEELKGQELLPLALLFFASILVNTLL